MGDDTKSTKSTKSKVEGEEEEEEDPRLEIIFSYLQRSLRVKPDTWAKLLKSKELGPLVMNFISDISIEKIIFGMNQSGLLVPSYDFPVAAKSKSCYFIKHKPEPLTKDNFRKIIMFGDIAAKPIEELEVLVEEVFVPLLTNPKNQRNWPRVIADDVTYHVNQLKNSIFEIRGLISGQTLLPMPDGVERVHEVEQAIIESDGETVDLQLKHDIEGVIIKWVKLIDDVLKEDSSCAFEREANPTPRFEIEFWNSRLKNLECIYDQLRDPRVRKMASILELTDSAYLPSYKKYYHGVVGAVTEARDITLYLKPLVKHFDTFENTEFKDAEPLIRPLIHVVTLVWANSRYYCVPSKIMTLIKEITNMLIQEATKFLDPTSLFQGEVDETRDHVAKCIRVFNVYRKTFEEYRAKLASFFPEGVEVVPWTFHPRTVFQRSIKFVERLSIIEDFFSTSMEFFKLEKVEIGGSKGRLLSAKIVGILNDFHTAFTVFGSITYDPLDPEDESFLKDYDIFKNKIKDFDHKLAAIFSQAFEDTNNLENIYKLIYVGGTLLERPIILKQITPKYKKVVTYMNDELDEVKEIYDEQLEYYNKKGYMLVDKNLPPVAGALMWINKLRGRMSIPFEILRELEIRTVEKADFQYQILKYHQMLDYLTELEKTVFEKWTIEVPEKCQRNLMKTILLQNEDTLELSLNFDDELVAVLKETFNNNNNTIMIILTVMQARERLSIEDAQDRRLWRFGTGRQQQLYNIIRLNSLPVEFELFAEEVDAIDNLLTQVVENLNWNSEDVWTYVGQIRTLVEDLYTRVLKAQQNVDRIHELINSWTLIPLFERKDGKKENLLYLDDRVDRVSQRNSHYEVYLFRKTFITHLIFFLFFKLVLEPYASVHLQLKNLKI
ncbi:hypothetical protein L9F63_010627, partial [Diploptera punctata]